jgi:small-conductance mechanosensitive channel
MEDIKIKDAYGIVSGKIESWLEAMIEMLPNIVVAIVVLVLFYFAAKAIKTVSGKLLDKAFSNKSLNNLLQNIIYISIITIGMFVALGILDLDKTVTSLLAGVGVIGLALGFAFQDTAANFVAGVFLAVRSPIEIGDIIQSVDVMGVVQKINLRATEVRTFQGTDVVIPNKDVFQNPLFNFTHSKERRVDLDCGVSYGGDLDKVKKVTLNAIENCEGVDQEKGVSFFYKEFGGSSINFQVRAWIKDIQQAGFLETQSNMIVALKKAFDANDIMIPFPIRTLDFGIKGGEKLSEMLIKHTSKDQAGQEN